MLTVGSKGAWISSCFYLLNNNALNSDDINSVVYIHQAGTKLDTKLSVFCSSRFKTYESEEIQGEWL